MSVVIPALLFHHKFIVSESYTKEELHNLISNDAITIEHLDQITIIQICEMARVYSLVNNIPGIANILQTWTVLGYTNNDPYIILYSNKESRLNAKASMFLKKKITGLVAVIPEEIYKYIP